MAKLLLEELSFSYGDKEILQGFSHSFVCGRPYVISAPSGRGKSTLLHLIAGLLTPRAGRITGGGIGHVAMAFQEVRLFPTLTACENAACAASVEAAAAFLAEFGFDTSDLHKLPSELSGGMQQRVSLARAFLAPGEILLLDEPTRGLDAALKERLAAKIREAAAHRIVIAVSHEVGDEAAWNAIRVTL